MTIDETLTRAYATLEQGAPDAEDALAALSTRLDGLGRRRAYRTAVTGVAAAGLAAAVALGVTYLPADEPTRPGGVAVSPRHAPTTESTVVDPSQPAVRQVAYSTHIATTTGSDGVARPVVPIAAGWLPNGATPYGAHVFPAGGGSLEWTMRCAHRTDCYRPSIGVYVQRGLPHGWRGWGKTVASDLTVQGRPARLYQVKVAGGAVGETAVAVDLGGDKIAVAESGLYEVRSLSRSDATAVVTHMARTMHADQHRVVPVRVRMTAAPADATIVAVESYLTDYPYTDYWLNADWPKGAQISIGFDRYDPSMRVKGKAGRPVQGKPTVVIRQKGHTILYIKGLFGQYTKLSTGVGAPTLADLYLIAGGLRADA